MFPSVARRRFIGQILRSPGSRCRKHSGDSSSRRKAAVSDGSLYECSTLELESLALREMIVVEDFITEKEEGFLLKDIEPKWRRLNYQFDHWDNAIQGYREKEISTWSSESLEILQRLRKEAFSELDRQRSLVHVLDLAKDGFIKPHIDSVKFCGRVIAGLSLLSPSVMRLVHEKDSNKHFSVLLKRRSLYVMKDSVRHQFTHEILKNDDSIFYGKKIEKGRRISVICRSDPESILLQNYEDIFKSKVVSLDPDQQ